MIYLKTDPTVTAVENFALMAKGARVTQEVIQKQEEFDRQNFSTKIRRATISAVSAVVLGILLVPSYIVVGAILSGAAFAASLIVLNNVLNERSRYQEKLNKEIVKTNSIYQGIQKLILNDLEGEGGKYKYIKLGISNASRGMHFNKNNFPGVFLGLVNSYDRHGNFKAQLEAAMNDQPVCSIISDTWQKFKEDGAEYLCCMKLYNELCRQYNVQ